MLHSSSIQIYAHTYTSGLNPWHLMHRHISTHILENQLFWSPFAQRTVLETIYRLNFFYRREISVYSEVELTRRGWVRLSPSSFPLVKIRAHAMKKNVPGCKWNFLFIPLLIWIILECKLIASLSYDLGIYEINNHSLPLQNLIYLPKSPFEKQMIMKE